MKNILAIFVVVSVVFWLAVHNQWFKFGEDADNASGARLEALVETLSGQLVDAAGAPVAAADSLDGKKFILVYFSAHWCPPCRTFTPELVKFYNDNHGGALFELIFVSSDKSEAEMFSYMREAGMPWPAAKYQGVAHNALQNAYAGRGIPCLVLLDPQGRVVSDSFDDGDYRGPHPVLKDLAKELAALPAPTTHEPGTLKKAMDKAATTIEKVEEKAAAAEPIIEGTEWKRQFPVKITMATAGVWKAMINDRFVQVGDMLDEKTRVRNVSRGLVIVERDGDVYELKQE